MDTPERESIEFDVVIRDLNRSRSAFEHAFYHKECVPKHQMTLCLQR